MLAYLSYVNLCILLQLTYFNASLGELVSNEPTRELFALSLSPYIYITYNTITHYSTLLKE